MGSRSNKGETGGPAKIAVGDAVRLKGDTDNPVMVVEIIDANGLTCIWHDKEGRLHTFKFSTTSLVLV